MALRIPAPRSPSASVIFLHGLGDSGHGWSFLPPEAHERPGLQHVNFVLPHAPKRFFPLFGMSQPGWLDWPTSNSETYISGLFETLESVKSLVEAEIKRGIDPSRIVVGGFSQGAALTQSLATTYTDHKLAGFISLSGFMPVSQALLKKRSDKNVDSPVFLAHGTDDPVVPFDELQNSKQQLSNNFLFTDVEVHTYANMPHSVCLPELEDIFAFLERAVPAK